MSSGWQAKTTLVRAQGERRLTDYATKREVQMALHDLGLDSKLVEWEGVGTFLIPITREHEEILRSTGYLKFESRGVVFELEMP